MFLVFPPPPPPAFLRSMDRIIDGFRDFDYYDRRDEYAREIYERRYPPPMMRGSRESRYMERPYPLPPMGSMSMRGDYGPSSREMFTRRSPPARGRGFGIYEDFSRDSFDDRRGMRGMSPPTHRYDKSEMAHRFAPY